MHYSYVKRSRTFEFAPLQSKDARGVAIKKVAFGEGGERLAFQFFEVASDGTTVVGESLVAKLSRFIEDCERDFPDIEAEADDNGLISKWAARDRFVRKFCERQNVAFSIAEEFNKKLDLIKRLDLDTPRVTFLECSVYYVQQEGGAESALLVEKKLDGKFSKWNGNNGVSPCMVYIDLAAVRLNTDFCILFCIAMLLSAVRSFKSNSKAKVRQETPNNVFNP
jgi:hypothetical protein